MDTAILVTHEVEQGQRIITMLDEAGLEPKVALWMVTPEYEEGRLVLASPLFDQSEPLKMYAAILEIISGSLGYERPTVLLLKMKDEMIRRLRQLFSRCKDVQGMRLGGHVIGNRFVSEAFVYRVR